MCMCVYVCVCVDVICMNKNLNIFKRNKFRDKVDVVFDATIFQPKKH